MHGPRVGALGGHGSWAHRSACYRTGSGLAHRVIGRRVPSTCWGSTNRRADFSRARRLRRDLPNPRPATCVRLAPARLRGVASLASGTLPVRLQASWSRLCLSTTHFPLSGQGCDCRTLLSVTAGWESETGQPDRPQGGAATHRPSGGLRGRPGRKGGQPPCARAWPLRAGGQRQQRRGWLCPLLNGREALLLVSKPVPTAKIASRRRSREGRQAPGRRCPAGHRTLRLWKGSGSGERAITIRVASRAVSKQLRVQHQDRASWNVSGRAKDLIERLHSIEEHGYAPLQQCRIPLGKGPVQNVVRQRGLPAARGGEGVRPKRVQGCREASASLHRRLRSRV
mmetsp:Transcript_19591/g.75147  ORF Transcript_19591/g.75147 Transcript_19591/m.75147 type:complete len:340 (+) Transcript_19591:2857-3876(+)